MPGNCLWMVVGEPLRVAQVGLAGFPPQQVGIGSIGQTAGDRVVVADTRLDAEETLGGSVVGDERAVALIDVGGQQLRRLGVGAAQQDGVHTFHVGRQAGGVQGADVLADRHQDLAAQMAALLLGRQLVFKVDARGAAGDHRAHQFVGVQRAAEAGFRVGDDRRHPVGAVFLPPGPPSDCAIWSQRRSALLMARTTLGTEFDRIQRLVGIHFAAGVGVAGHLPAGQIDRLQAGLDLLHRLIAGQRAQGVHERFGFQQVPQAGGAHFRQRVADAEGTGQALNILRRVVPADAGEPLRIAAGAGQAVRGIQGC